MYYVYLRGGKSGPIPCVNTNKYWWDFRPICSWSPDPALGCLPSILGQHSSQHIFSTYFLNIITLPNIHFLPFFSSINILHITFSRHTYVFNIIMLLSMYPLNSSVSAFFPSHNLNENSSLFVHIVYILSQYQQSSLYIFSTYFCNINSLPKRIV